MKKNLLCLTSCVFFLLSCQRTKPPAPVDKWSDYRKAYAFLNHRTDSAFYYFNQLAENSKDSEQVAISYNIMASILSDAGDYFGAQENLLLSLRYLHEKDTQPPGTLANVYNELGLTSIRLKNNDAALPFFDQAIKYEANPGKKLAVLNNKALAYQEKGAYSEALKIYRAALVQTTNRRTYARILTNMARTQWLAQPEFNAAPGLLRALNIRIQEKDSWGQNASYAHLADFYTLTKPDSALFFARQMYAAARQLQSPDDQLEALQKLIKLSPPKELKGYFTRFQQLSDSVQTARNAAKNQFALIRYDVEKQKSTNLELQKDNSDKKYQLMVLLIILLAGSVGSVLWYRKVRSSAREKMRKNELRLSQRVHDVVANGIYRVMNEVEYGEEIDKEQLLDQLEVMYEQSRDISYEPETPVAGDFADKVTGILNAFKSSAIKLAVTGNDSVLWHDIRPQIQREIEPVLQEIMVNMTKHSQASQALIAFEIDNGALQIDYRDNGVGFPDHFKAGNGLRNTGNRIKALRGELKFVPEASGGARIQLVIPISY